MNQLSRFKKRDTKAPEKVVTSMNIEKRHLEFLKKNNLNLSAIVRDTLEKLIKSAS